MSVNPGRARNNLNGAVVRIAGDNNGDNGPVRHCSACHDRGITAQNDACADIVGCIRVMAHLCAERIICRQQIAFELSCDARGVSDIDCHVLLRDKAVIVDNRAGGGEGARAGEGVGRSLGDAVLAVAEIPVIGQYGTIGVGGSCGKADRQGLVAAGRSCRNIKNRWYQNACYFKQGLVQPLGNSVGLLFIIAGFDKVWRRKVFSAAVKLFNEVRQFGQGIRVILCLKIADDF